MKRMVRVVVLLLSFFIEARSASNILISHPFYAGSHVLTLHKVAEALIGKGHRVTTLRFADSHNFNLKDLGVNHREIVLRINNTDGDLALISREDGRFLTPNSFFWNYGLEVKGLFLGPDNPLRIGKRYVQTLLGNSSLLEDLAKEKFDLAVIDLLNNQAGLALAHHLKIPSKVAFWAFSFVNGECEYCQVSLPASHIPSTLTEYTQEMNLGQRMVNFAYKYFIWGLLSRVFYELMDGYIKEQLPELKHQHTLEMMAELNGVIINSDDVLDYPRLRGSTVLNVGGLQINKEVQPLPENIESWMNEAEDGVILISLGFVFGFEGVPKERVQNIIQSFRDLPQRVLFKFEGQLPQNVPSNFLVLPFVPQQAILAHPKLVMFFTHGGMHGVLEAVYFGVPMVGLPIFVDQADVCAKIVYKGIGRCVTKSSSSEEIQGAISEVISNPTYRENIKEMSRMFRLRRTHPMDDVVWLVDYLIQTNGSLHSISQGQRLNSFVYHSFDVVILYLLIAVIGAKLIVAKLCGKMTLKVFKLKRD